MFQTDVFSHYWFFCLNILSPHTLAPNGAKQMTPVARLTCNAAIETIHLIGG